MLHEYETVQIAELLGVDTIVLMSGLPAGGAQDSRPNWVTCAWPLENGEILSWQWNDKLLPYGWLSIEHEDIVLSRMEGMRRSIDLLKRTMIDEASDYGLPVT